MAEPSRGWMRIADLERLSGIPRRAIHYFLKLGLLHPPRRTGKTMAYYDMGHLMKLTMIREAQDRGLSPGAVREYLDRVEGLDGNDSELAATVPAAPETAPAPVARARRGAGDRGNREAILDQGRRFFTEKGLSQTRVNEIIQELNIGKGTFYFYFKDKKDLFLECVPWLFESMFSGGWEKIRAEKDPVRRLEMRAHLVSGVMDDFCAILRLAREAMEDPEPRLRDMGRKIHRSIHGPVEADIESGIRQGRFPEMDPRAAAAALVGAFEGIHSMASVRGGISPEDLTRQVRHLFSLLFQAA
ncbi:MAG: MerR family transcriptional regulator [Proteobacteria bacterium]|nr:MerR family transcriptional regulator [Pseudomonadota bacterium]